MVHNVADHNDVIGISYNKAIKILSQPGEAVSGSVCERWRYWKIQSFKRRVYVSKKRRYRGPAALLGTFVHGSIVPIRFGIKSLHHEVNYVP